jgi:hypothetical protein
VFALDVASSTGSGGEAVEQDADAGGEGDGRDGECGCFVGLAELVDGDCGEDDRGESSRSEPRVEGGGGPTELDD